VLAEAGLDPSYVIGGQLLAAGANSKLGVGEFIVVEADESDASFLFLNPVISVVTNIDADHMETYGHSLERLHAAFVDFLHRLPFYGRAVLCSDDAGVRAILPRLQRPVLSYGTDEGAAGFEHVRAVNVQALVGGQMAFTAQQAGHADLAVTLNLAGLHNVRNALAAIAVARELEVPDAPIAAALAAFAGVGRRFQRHGELPTADGGRALLIDDYGHHPVEMAAVLAAARGAFPGRRLVLAFQPHRHTRTRDCFADFAVVLQGFDAVLLADIYAAGEAPIAGISSASLAATVPRAQSVGDIAALPAALHEVLRGGDVLITMGAGSIGGLPRQLMQEGAAA
jgi:UDP-N-acetylmuramate--alanine ligase